MKKYLSVILFTAFMTMETAAQTTIETRLVVTQNDGSNGGSFKVAIQAKGTNLTAANTIGSGTIDIHFDNTKLAPDLIVSNYVRASYNSTISNYGDKSITYISAGSYIRFSLVGSNINNNFDGTPAGLDLTASYVTLAIVNFTILDNTAITNLSIKPASLTIGLFDSHNNENFSYVINGQSMNTPADIVSQPLPVELVSFTAKAQGRAVELRWSTAAEKNNYGFEIERASAGPSGFRTAPAGMQSGAAGGEASRNGAQSSQQRTWQKIGFVEGRGTTSAPQTYAYADRGAASGSYAYRLKQIDRDGGFSYSHEALAELEAPKAFALMQNFPNPFNPSTRIPYDIAEAGIVRLSVYDLLGREMMVLVNEHREPGTYAAEMNAARLPSGLYFYRLEAGRFSAVKKLTVMK